MAALWRKRWKPSKVVPQQFLQRFSDLHPLVVQILYNRGLRSEEEVAAFLNGTVASDNPFLMKGVDEAVTLIRQAITDRASIAIYGDYDVDGVTATAILVQTLRAQGANVRPYIPDRQEEGYGLNPDAIAGLAEDGVRMLITVDCGIRSPQEVALARQLGMQIIVTDHHHIGDGLPPANAVINPRRSDSRYPFIDFAGAGVAYKLAQALIRVNDKSPLRTTATELFEEDLLDLVALGTVADMVPLLGENHVLVRQGLAQLNAARRPGLAALMQLIGTKPGTLTSTTLGYTLGPRLNAAGRIDDPLVAFDLLMASDFSGAVSLAQKLEAINDQRRACTMQVQQKARALALGLDGDASEAEVDAFLDSEASPVPSLLFAASSEFPVGIIGLAAGRLVEEFSRPAVVVEMNGEFSKGSARSLPGFHITEALDCVRDLLVRHGGHEAAAGFTVRTEDLDVLRTRLVALAEEHLSDMRLTPTLDVDADVPWMCFPGICTARWMRFPRSVIRTRRRFLRPRGFGWCMHMR